MNQIWGHYDCIEYFARAPDGSRRYLIEFNENIQNTWTYKWISIPEGKSARDTPKSKAGSEQSAKTDQKVPPSIPLVLLVMSNLVVPIWTTSIPRKKHATMPETSIVKNCPSHHWLEPKLFAAPAVHIEVDALESIDVSAPTAVASATRFLGFLSCKIKYIKNSSIYSFQSHSYNPFVHHQ